MSNDKAIARETLRRLYLFSRKVIKFCKKHNSDQICMNLIVYTIGQKPSTIKELTALFDVTQPCMSSIISRLEKKGIVSKKPKEDSRYRVVMLTPKGKQLLDDIRSKMDAHCNHVFKDLSQEEITNVGNIVKKINFEYDEKVVKI